MMLPIQHNLLPTLLRIAVVTPAHGLEIRFAGPEQCAGKHMSVTCCSTHIHQCFAQDIQIYSSKSGVIFQ